MDLPAGPMQLQRDVQLLFRKRGGIRGAWIEAFDDTWHWNIESERSYREVVTDGPKKLADLLQAMLQFASQLDMD